MNAGYIYIFANKSIYAASLIFELLSREDGSRVSIVFKGMFIV